MATMDSLMKMMYLRNTLGNSRELKKTRTINKQIKLYNATSKPLLDQAKSLVTLSDKSNNIPDLSSILQSFDSLNLGVGQHDNQIKIEASKVKTKIAGINASIAIKADTDRLMESTSTEGMKKTVTDLTQQKNIISENISKEINRKK